MFPLLESYVGNKQRQHNEENQKKEEATERTKINRNRELSRSLVYGLAPRMSYGMARESTLVVFCNFIIPCFYLAIKIQNA